MEIDYKIVFEESWSVGSGEASGSVLDAVVRRDGDGLPFVPGTTLRGLARDAVRDLAQILGEDLCSGTLTRTDGDLGDLCGVTRKGTPCLHCTLFGSPQREGKVSWGPARQRLPVTLPKGRKAFAEQASLVPGLLTRAHLRTAIDPESGRADDEHLFSAEEARPVFALEGSVELHADLSPRHVAILVAALRSVRALGGGRRRGLGACRLRIERARLAPHFDDWEEAIRHLAKSEETNSREAGPQEAPLELPPTALTGTVLTGTVLTGTVLRVRATTVGEVVLGGNPESGNQITGLAHVPGSTLRGALAGRWRDGYESEAFRRSFLSGRVRFGYLYPRLGRATGLPTPSSRHTCKEHPGSFNEGGHGHIDLLLTDEVEECPCGSRLVPAKAGFEKGRDHCTTDLLVSPHNRIDPARQTVSAGSLFAYQALPEGTELSGFLRADTPEDLHCLLAGLGFGGDLTQEPLRFRLRVGRRRGALGYLECELQAFPGVDSGVGLFADADRLPRAASPGDVRIDLLTPAILLDEDLRSRGCLLPADLGLERAEFDASYASTQAIAGWNVAHALPKADEPAVTAGSSFLLSKVSEAELASLRKKALTGVGRRRAEGFGAFTIAGVDLAAGATGTLRVPRAQETACSQGTEGDN